MNNLSLKDKQKISEIEDVKYIIIDRIEPPSNTKQIFEQFIEEIKQELTQDNQKVWLLKFYIVIVFCHIFPNANGRTARFLYQKLNGVSIDPQTIEKRLLETNEFYNNINNQAVINMCKDIEYSSSEIKEVVESIYSGFDQDKITHLPPEPIKRLKFELIKIEISKLAIKPDQLEKDQIEKIIGQAYDHAFNKISQIQLQEMLKLVENDSSYFITYLDRVLLK